VHQRPAVPVDVDLTPVAAAAAKAPRSTRQARRGDKQPASTAVKNAGIVVVVPDVLDGIVSVCDAAGLKGRSKLICTIGLLLLIVP